MLLAGFLVIPIFLALLLPLVPIVVKVVVDQVDHAVKIPKSLKAPLAVAVGVGAGAIAHAAGASLEDSRTIAEATGGGALIVHAATQGWSAVKDKRAKNKADAQQKVAAQHSSRPPDADRDLPPNPFGP